MQAGVTMLRTTRIHIELVACQPGLWCNDCMLSTGHRHHLALTYPSGVTTLTQRVGCEECEGRRIT